MAIKKEPRGLRNCNPGNIRINGDLFKGELRPSRDSQFKTFISMGYGYRAMFKTLDTYIRRYRLDTVEKIIARWAPMNENNTSAYIRLVEKYSGIPRDKVVSTDDANGMCAIVAAMSRVENGVQASMPEVERGWRLFTNGGEE